MRYLLDANVLSEGVTSAGTFLQALRSSAVIRSQICWCVLITWFCCGTAWGAVKTPVPDAAEQKLAIVTVKEIFKSELASAKSSAQFADIAERMLGNLQSDESSAVNDYVLLTQAHGLAVKALYPTLSLRIVQMISDKYEVDQHTLTVQTLKDLAKGPTDKDLHKQLAELSFKLSLEHQRADRIEAALQHLELADVLARRLKSSEMLKQATARRAEITEYKKLVAGSAAAAKTLVDAPSDPAANEAIGRFLILAKSDWNEGLTRLVLASDATLQKLAQQDTLLIEAAKPPTAEAAGQLADGWWEFAQKQPVGNFRNAVKLRSGQWYAFAIPNLKGLTKAKAEQRGAESGWTNDLDLAILMPLNRREVVIQKAISVGKGMLGERFAIVQTLPFADFVPLTEALKPRRWRPIRVRPYPTPEGLKVAAIWLYSSVEGQLFDGTTEEVEKHHTDIHANGFTAVDLAGYVDANKQVRHVLASAKVKWETGTNIDITLHKLIDGTPFKTPVEKGCATQTRQQYYDAEGKLFNDVVWRHPKGSFYIFRGARADWEKEIVRVSATQKLLDVSILAKGKGNNYTAIFQGFNGFTVTEIHGKTLDENLIEWQKLADAKAHPAGIGVSVTSDGIYHSTSVWHNSSK